MREWLGWTHRNQCAYSPKPGVFFGKIPSYWCVIYAQAKCIIARWLPFSSPIESRVPKPLIRELLSRRPISSRIARDPLSPRLVCPSPRYQGARPFFCRRARPPLGSHIHCPCARSVNPSSRADGLSMAMPSRVGSACSMSCLSAPTTAPARHSVPAANVALLGRIRENEPRLTRLYFHKALLPLRR